MYTACTYLHVHTWIGPPPFLFLVSSFFGPFIQYLIFNKYNIVNFLIHHINIYRLNLFLKSQSALLKKALLGGFLRVGPSSSRLFPFP